MRTAVAVIGLTIAMAHGCLAGGVMDAETRGVRATEAAGAPVNLVPWTYVWRADRKRQTKPEAYFIPRRLERLDRVYRTARQALAPDQLKSLYYDQRDLLKEFPPRPKGRLQVGLLWTGGLAEFTVELRWRKSVRVPALDAVEVRSYPTAFGWFGFTVDRVLGPPEVSPDGLTWTYRSPVGEEMDTSYSGHVPAATEMIAVFCSPDTRGAYPPVPEMRLTSAQLGRWRRGEAEIEWGLLKGRPADRSTPRLEPTMAFIESVRPLADSRRKGVAVSLLWAPDARPGLDSRLTIRGKPETATISLKDLERGPILLPRHDLFIARAGEGVSAREFERGVAQRNLKSMRQMTREHPETRSFEEIMREARLWACPPDTRLEPFPRVPDAPMDVRLSDEGWTAAWRAAANQLTGAHMWGGLAFEVARVTHAMDMIGLHDHSEKVYRHFLDGPGAKPDGDYSDGRGALEWATSMRHDMGYSHDGTHASTGRLLYSMAERCLLTRDREWFARNRRRLQDAADWIIRQRSGYMAHVPDRDRLFVAGLMPPCMLGDYALPACDWHWYYVDNALAVQGLARFADALADLDPKEAQRYRREAEAFRRDLRRAVEREAALSPVRLGCDGMYHTFIPRMAYARGLTGPEIGAPQFPECDWWMGALPLAELCAAMDAADPRMRDTLDMMEEMGTSAEAVRQEEEARRKLGLPTADAWFRRAYSILPKASHTANVYLLQDDVPSFLRFWMNEYAVMVGADGKLWEHAHPGSFDACGAPDNGTAGWFIENFRNMLVMEDGPSLWIARGTPRAWLEQDKTIRVSNAPTVFGPVSYEIRSNAGRGRIEATIRIPERNRPASVIVRFRHPSAAPMRSAKVNGRNWDRFDTRTETIRLSGLSGEVAVVAEY